MLHVIDESRKLNICFRTFVLVCQEATGCNVQHVETGRRFVVYNTHRIVNGSYYHWTQNCHEFLKQRTEFVSKT